jgi:hypothetical protein
MEHCTHARIDIDANDAALATDCVGPMNFALCTCGGPGDLVHDVRCVPRLHYVVRAQVRVCVVHGRGVHCCSDTVRRWTKSAMSSAALVSEWCRMSDNRAINVL